MKEFEKEIEKKENYKEDIILLRKMFQNLFDNISSDKCIQKNLEKYKF